MDALPGQLGIKPEDVAEGLKVAVVEDVFATTMAAMRESGKRVKLVYELEDKLPPAAQGPVEWEPDENVRALALKSCRRSRHRSQYGPER